MNALQLIAFIPVIQFHLPLLAQITLKALIKVVTFDFLSVFESLDVGFIQNSIEAGPFSEGIENIGIESLSTTDNNGTLNYLIGFLGLKAVIFFVHSFCFCNKFSICRKLNRGTTGPALSAQYLRFSMETVLDLLLCTLVSVIPSQEPNLFAYKWEEMSSYDKFSKVQTFFIWACLAVFALLNILWAVILVRLAKTVYKPKKKLTG